MVNIPLSIFIYRVSTILLVVQDFFHYLPSTVVLVKSSLVSLFQCTSHILEWLGYLHSNFKRSLIVLRLGVSWISGCHWVMASNHLKLKVILQFKPRLSGFVDTSRDICCWLFLALFFYHVPHCLCKKTHALAAAVYPRFTHGE